MHTLKTRIVLIVLAIFLSGLLALMAYTRHTVISDMKDLLGKQQFSMVSTVAASVSHALWERIVTLQEVARPLSASIIEHPEEALRYLEARRALNSRFSVGTFITRLDGEIIAAVPVGCSGRSGTNYQEREHVMRAIREDKPQISPFVVSKESGKTEVVLTVPIRDATGYVIGTLSGVIALRNLNFIQDSGERVKVGELMLINPEQRLSASSTEASGTARRLPAAGENVAIDRLLEGFEGAEVMRLDKSGESLVAAKRLSLTGWLIVAARPMEEAFLPANEIDQRLFAAAVFMALIVALSVFAALRQQLFPLTRATSELAKRSGEEPRIAPLVVERHDEVGQLITAFNRMQENLVQSESRFRQMMESSYAAIFLTDMNRTISYANTRMSEIFGIPNEELIGRPYLSLVDNSQINDCRAKTEEALTTTDRNFSVDHERLFLRADGTRFWGRINGRPFYDGLGRHTGLLTVMIDISETKRLEQKLALDASVFEHAQEGILIASADGIILDVNHSFTRITGYSREEAIGQNPRFLQSGKHGRDFYQKLWKALETLGRWSGEIWNCRKDGVIYPEFLTISTIRDSSGKVSHYVSVFSDLSVMKEQERQIEVMAHYDTLTGLPNRALLSDRMHQAMAAADRSGQLIAIIHIDLDDFKAVNDKYGEVIGDKTLLTFSARIKETMRESDTLARIGGDEFIVILTGLTEAPAVMPTIQRLLGAANQPIDIDGTKLRISASLGVTFYPQAGKMNDEQLLRQADQAMYRAKLGGKNAFHFFDTEQDHSLRHYYEHQEVIRQALKNREFELYYQPKVNMRTGAIIGAEALIRWRRPGHGLLAPAAFLPFIENHPLSCDVGEWVISEALSQMDAWRDAGINLPVSINVSATELEHPDFLSKLKGHLRAHPKILPGNFEMEVLESSALKDLDNVSGIIDACRALGVRIALDDFGTGYSSLTYLRRLSADCLKIDQSFVREMLVNPDDFIILEGVINMGNAFRRDTIAEGVETIEHGVLLLQLGCENAQGYGVARPMPPGDLPGWIAAWKPPSAWIGQEPISKRFFPVLLASIEHRAWLDTLNKHLESGFVTQPQLNLGKCRFSVWLDNESRDFPDLQERCQRIDQIHQKTHEMAEQLCTLYSEGKNGETRRRLAENLSASSTGLLDELSEFVANC